MKKIVSQAAPCSGVGHQLKGNAQASWNEHEEAAWAPSKKPGFLNARHELDESNADFVGLHYSTISCIAEGVDQGKIPSARSVVSVRRLGRLMRHRVWVPYRREPINPCKRRQNPQNYRLDMYATVGEDKIKS